MRVCSPIRSTSCRISRGRGRTNSANWSVREAHGASPAKSGPAAKLTKYLDKSHYGVQLAKDDVRTITLWLDLSSPEYGVYPRDGGDRGKGRRIGLAAAGRRSGQPDGHRTGRARPGRASRPVGRAAGNNLPVGRFFKPSRPDYKSGPRVISFSPLALGTVTVPPRRGE